MHRSILASPSCFCVALLVAACATTSLLAAEPPARIEPLVRVVDLNVGESADVTLTDGLRASVKLLDLKETHDTVSRLGDGGRKKVLRSCGRPISANTNRS